MSEENVEIIRRGMDAFNREDLDALLEHVSPEVEFKSYLLGLEGELPKGHAGGRLWWDRVKEAFPDLRYDIQETRDLGETVIVKFLNTGTGPTSGVPIELTLWSVFFFRDGKVIRWESFRTEAEAFEAAGLSE
jgi:ketosteroid isomerase-like protein